MKNVFFYALEAEQRFLIDWILMTDKITLLPLGKYFINLVTTQEHLQ